MRHGATLVIVALLVAGASAEDLHITTANITILGSDLVAPPLRLGPHVFLSHDGQRGFLRDDTMPAHPTIVSSYYYNDRAIERPDYRGGLLLGVAYGSDPGATLIDLSVPEMPVELSSGFAPYDYSSVRLGDGVAYLCSAGLLFTYDLSDPDVPALSSIAVIEDGDAYRWPTLGVGVLYLVAGPGRLHVYDVSQPRMPQDLGIVTLVGGRVDGMVAVGTTLITVAADSVQTRLVTYDMSHPLAPLPTASSELPIPPAPDHMSIARAGDLLVVGSASGGLQACSIADPAHPVPGAAIDDVVDALAMDASTVLVYAQQRLRTYAYAAYDEPPTQLREQTRLPWLQNVVKEHDLAVGVTRNGRALVLFDLSQPDNPRQLAPAIPGGFGRPALLGSLLAACDTMNVRLFDVSDPAHPHQIAQLPHRNPGLRGNCQLDRNVLAVNFVSGALQLYDVTNPAQPWKGGRIEEGALSVRIAWPWLMTGTTAYLRTYLVRETAHPLLVSATYVSDLRDVAFVGEHPVALTGSRFNVYESIADRVMYPIGQGLVANAHELDIDGDRLYATGYRNATVFDIADLEHPVEVASLHDPAGFDELAVDDGIACIGGQYGLLVVHESATTTTARDVPPTAIRLAPPAPNPFNPATTLSFDLARAGRATLAVYDLRGRRVRTLADEVLPAGPHQVTWRGDDDAGRAMASGVYLVRLQSAGGAVSRRATLVR